MKVVFVRSYLVRTDSRLHRYFRALQQQNVPYLTLGWDRTGIEPDTEDCRYWHRPSPVGGGLRNFGRILAFNLFCLRELWRSRKQTFCVHAVDLDGALGAAVFSAITGKPLIFDAFDKYSDTRNLTGPVKWVCDQLERWCMRAADWVLLPDACRVEQHGLEGWQKVFIIENVPAERAMAPKFNPGEVVEHDRTIRASHSTHCLEGDARQSVSTVTSPLKLVYVGTLEPVHRGLENLLRAVAEYKGSVHLTLAGTGPLAEQCDQYAQRYANIHFCGEVLPEDAMTLMAEGDIIVGMYYLSSRNHRFAAPNKYYEHLMLGKALLTSLGTPPGERVGAHHTGWAIADTYEALQRWLQGLNRADVEERSQRAALLWRAHYADYFDRVLLQGYAQRVAQWRTGRQST